MKTLIKTATNEIIETRKILNFSDKELLNINSGEWKLIDVSAELKQHLWQKRGRVDYDGQSLVLRVVSEWDENKPEIII